MILTLKNLNVKNFYVRHFKMELGRKVLNVTKKDPFLQIELI